MRSRVGRYAIVLLVLFMAGCGSSKEVITLKCPPKLPTLDDCKACDKVTDDDAAWNIDGLRIPGLKAAYLRERAARVECVSANDACVEQAQARVEAHAECG